MSHEKTVSNIKKAIERGKLTLADAIKNIDNDIESYKDFIETEEANIGEASRKIEIFKNALEENEAIKAILLSEQNNI